MRDTISRDDTLKVLGDIKAMLSKEGKLVMEQAMTAVEHMPACGSVTVEDAVDRLHRSGWLDKHYKKLEEDNNED